LKLARAAILGLALAVSFAAKSADMVRHSVPKHEGGDTLGMYSNYADEGSAATQKYLGDAGAAMLSDAELMPALVSALYQISKYQRLVASPEIIRVPHERIERLVCLGKCAALAAYIPGAGIYLDEKLNPGKDLFHRSILLHELVHYAQDMSEEHDDMKPCMRWYQREQEAYAIQKIFLFMTGSPTRVGYSAQKSTCDE
jgi:hypothetical protein